MTRWTEADPAPEPRTRLIDSEDDNTPSRRCKSCHPSRCGCRCHEALDHCDACETPGAFRLCCGDHQARMCSRCHEANHEAAS